MSVLASSFDSAVEDYRSGKFVEAKNAFEALAAIGDRSALFNLGAMNYRGDATKQDKVRGVALMQLANTGFDDPGFEKIISRVLSTMTEEQISAVPQKLDLLRPQFDISQTLNKVLFKPLSDEECEQDVTLVVKAVTKYPNSEAARGQMGIVQYNHTISPEGYIRDIVIVDATTKRFRKASLKALPAYRFARPADGKPVYNHRDTQTFHLLLSGGVTTLHGTDLLKNELELLKKTAENGDSNAQYIYANRINAFRHFAEYLKSIDLQYRTANAWYEKAALQGLPDAQFEMGLNMLKGLGCEPDTENGMKWIKAAALAGHSSAQGFIARKLTHYSSVDDSKERAAINWLRNAVLSGDETAHVLLAWRLATTTQLTLSRPKESLSLLKRRFTHYVDPVRINETKAAAYAALGDFNKAVKYQKKANKLADKYQWDIPLVKERLAMYESNQAYFGGYFTL